MALKKISSRFSMAVHILSLLATGDGATLTSERMAGSINTNPVVVRKIMGMLKKAGFLNVRAGTGGAYLLKNIEDISLLDVYRAVEVVEEHDLFNFHDNPNPDCPVGANIESVFRSTLLQAQNAMEQVLADVPLKQLVHDLNEKISSSES
ncbi:Rrf2 family transcriptional regulator [Paenibacillus rigui]|uniref:Transcriptional regulator n=1 Tax=Paenibacillus rigui TaxID=554312 RepID=A0A229USP3_9BACL|nr:Rrf2 family transcriptional regulator [Paenibacillus rigui]OXM86546.1 transcriptional regulator [Paenibacillus rigui]